MPPQLEYVLIRDTAMELIYLAQNEFNNGKYKLVCLLVFLAEALLNYSLDIRQGSSISYSTRINVNELIKNTLSKNSKEDAEECLREALELAKTVNRVFMEKREEECSCWGE